MFKALSQWFARKTAPAQGEEGSTAPVAEGEADPHAMLTMTDELRSALFPKAPQMVSTLFERPPLSRSSPDSGHRSSGKRSFPIL